jgi:hypothetical protein
MQGDFLKGKEEMTHTPGPWTFRPFMGGDEHIAQLASVDLKPTKALTNEGQRYVMAAESRVALVDMQAEVKKTERWHADDAERDANARLIAAAPDLLEAANMAEGAVAQLCEGQDPANECWNVLSTIRAAIAKAEGTK